MSQIDLMTVRLTWVEEPDEPVPPTQLRGAIGDHFRDDPLFHQHEGDRFVYRYPRIHYRWDGRASLVVGLGEGVRALAERDWPGLTFRIGRRAMQVREAEYRFATHEVRLTPRLVRYEFGWPWLPFNRENFVAYEEMRPEEQALERDRLAVGGLLVAMRQLGVYVTEQLYAAVQVAATHLCPYKGVDLLGFTGQLLANVDLPDGFALGRAVSHGHGWLRRAIAVGEEQ